MRSRLWSYPSKRVKTKLIYNSWKSQHIVGTALQREYLNVTFTLLILNIILNYLLSSQESAIL